MVKSLRTTSLALFSMAASMTTAASTDSDDFVIPQVELVPAGTRKTFDDYNLKTCEPTVWEIKDDTAMLTEVHFSVIRTPGDIVIVSELDGSNPQTFIREARDGITTEPVHGKGARVEFRPAQSGGCVDDNAGDDFNLAIDYVDFTTDPATRFSTQAICGGNEQVNTNCFVQEAEYTQSEDSQLYTDIYRQGRATLRLRRLDPVEGYLYYCTAWLWGNEGHFITNNHCMKSQEWADNTELQFLVEQDCGVDCKYNDCPSKEVLAGKGNIKFLETDEEYDWALLQITNNAKYYNDVYGYQQIRAKGPEVGEEIFILGHPHAGPTMTAVTDDQAGNEWPEINSIDDGVIRYSVDTEGGSSGSSVHSKVDFSVVGLHRFGICAPIPANGGTSSSVLADALSAYASTNDGLV